MSMLLAAVVPVMLWALSYPASMVWSAVGLFPVQYLFATLAARNSGIRMVTNVLCLHAVAKQA